MAKKSKKDVKHIAVALQGGGSHGAFTWGVLDRLLDEEEIALDGFCGTSAGAMNATILAHGLQVGGRTKAKELLYTFWKKVSDQAIFSLLQPSLLDKSIDNGNMDYSFGFWFSEIVSMYASPYQFNPVDYNPLRDILLDIVDFDKLKSCEETKLFVCATNVRRGRAKVFDMEHISCDAVLASCCLPFLFKAITIDGEDYWDGGYMGNPPIFPLIDGTSSSDILIVQINPINIDETPKDAVGIRDRVNEISFNASLMHEMRKIDLVDRLLKKGMNLDDRFRDMYIHNINPEVDLAYYNVSSKLNATWDFITYLHDLGRKYADEWIEENLAYVGVKSTCDVRETFL
ncbi:MAG: patatin-like phospholipase family protein [Thermonemataceae bacterium]